MNFLIRAVLVALMAVGGAGLHHDANAESFSGRMSPGLARFKESMKGKLAALKRLTIGSAGQDSIKDGSEGSKPIAPTSSPNR